MDNSDQSTFFTSLREYFSHDMLDKIYQDALATFSDVSEYEKELSSANILVSEYFSGKSLPELAMHVSGFRENVIILNNLISISIDKYLGDNYQAYSDFSAIRASTNAIQIYSKGLHQSMADERYYKGRNR